jgi:hypothetical protein
MPSFSKFSSLSQASTSLSSRSLRLAYSGLPGSITFSLCSTSRPHSVLHHSTIRSFACMKIICSESSLIEYSLIDTNIRSAHGNCSPLLW